MTQGKKFFRRPMTYPGWYPSEEFPGKMQWWDGSKLTVETRIMTPQEKKEREAEEEQDDSPHEEKQKSAQALDWLTFIPTTAGIAALFWLGFAVLPFATGERSVIYEKVNAPITSVTHKQRTSFDVTYSRRRGPSVECTVHVTAPIEGKHYKATAGSDCNREPGMKTPMVYDPKDIEGTLSNGLLPDSHYNAIYAAGTAATAFGAAGLLRWLRKPLQTRKPRKRKRRRSASP